MAEYGFTYRSFSTYGTTRNIETRGPVIKPFVPSKDDNGIGNKKKLSEGYVTKKTIVPITSGPYANHDSASATETYNTNHHPSKGDDETSPVRGYPRKVDEGGSRPQRFSPVAPHPTPTPTGANNGYGGDYVTGNREGRKPVIGGGTIRNNDGSYNNGTNYGYGDREGRKPVGISSTNKKNPNYDHEYPSGYGGEDYNNRSKEGYYNKPSRNGGGNYDNDYGNKEAGYKPTNNGYDYGGSNKEGPRKPIGHYDDHDYNRSKEGYKPTSLIPVGRNNNKGGYGFGNGNNNNDDKEQYRRAPFGSTNTNYSDDDDGIGGDRYNKKKKKKEGQMMNKPSNSVWNRPRIIPGWTAAPRKGTQLSEPTHDIDKALEYLKIEAAKHDRRPNSRLGAGDLESTAGNSSPNGADTHTHTIDRIRRPGGATWPLPSTSPTRVKVTDHDGRYAAAAAAADYIYSDDDDDDHDHDHDAYTNTRRYGGVIDSDEAEKKFKGTRV